MPSKLQAERNAKINYTASIIIKTFKHGRKVDKEKLVLVLMKDFLTTRRTAVEYINSAKVFVNYSEEKGILKKETMQEELDVEVRPVAEESPGD